jgi:ABC-type polysaccharide/polyol phosphate transport system ATPase subunit
MFNFSEIVICVVGLDEAGKTTAIKVIKGGEHLSSF